jgi:hypothetical protein
MHRIWFLVKYWRESVVKGVVTAQKCARQGLPLRNHPWHKHNRMKISRTVAKDLKVTGLSTSTGGTQGINSQLDFCGGAEWVDAGGCLWLITKMLLVCSYGVHMYERCTVG